LRKERSDLIDAALRSEPEYQELCELLPKQTSEQRERLTASLSQQCEDSQEGEEIMEKDVDSRIAELKAIERLTYAEIKERLALEGYQDSTGHPFSLGAIKSRYYRLKKKDRSQQSQPGETSTEASLPADRSETCQEPTIEMGDSQTSQHGEPAESESVSSQTPKPSSAPSQVPQLCEAPESATQSSEPSPETIPVAWLRPLREMIREEIKTAMNANDATRKQKEIELLPVTPRHKGSRKLKGSKINLPGTSVDSVLHELFQRKRAEFGGNASGAMQFILWNFFNKPKLSFEED
jgi:hypothetical protein